MDSLKFKKEEIKVIVIMILGATLLGTFIEGGANIAVLIYFSYISHKYLGNIENTVSYENYEFIDEEKYKIGLKYFLIFLDVYIIIRIVSIILIKYDAYNMGETLLIVMIMLPYEKYLSKKYVKHIHNKDENIKTVFIKYKTITITMCIVFIAFTISFFTWINNNKEDGHVKLFKYEYNLTSNDSKKAILLKSNSIKLEAKENEKNEKYFDTYLKKSNKWIDLQVLKIYSYIGIGFMLVMILIQNIKVRSSYIVKSEIQLVFLAGILLCTIIAFNDIYHNMEYELVNYFYEYIH